MVRSFVCSALLCAAVSFVGAASAATVGYELVIHTVGSGNTPNMPQFELTNRSDAAAITRFSFTIGLIDRNFDAIYADDDGDSNFSTSIGGTNTASSIAYTVADLDVDQTGGVRSDLVDITFSGFAPNRRFVFRADIDRDSRDTTEDFTTVFFNNGTSPNSQVSVWFASGDFLELALPESPLDLESTADFRFVFTQAALSRPLPEPGTGSLLLGALLAGVASHRRRAATCRKFSSRERKCRDYSSILDWPGCCKLGKFCPGSG